MTVSRIVLVSVAVLTATLGAAASQAPPASPPAPRAPAGQGRGGRGGTLSGPRNAYPDRPPADPAALEHGKALYGVNCAFCHGADTRGGDSGGPSLLRSSIVLDDQHGELMAPVIQNGRLDRGMPKFALTIDQIADVAAFIHSFKAAGYDESRQKPPSILVGNAKAGEAFFNAKCSSCHSAMGDLRGLASKIPDERILQQTWLMPGSGGGRGGPPPVPAPPVTVTVTVTLASGEKVEGTLAHIDDFVVSLTTGDGSYRSFRTNGDVPRVEIHDPLQPHRELWRVYTDADIHNVTAFLVTLK
jgi:cytochrome c oxidase cbb3-type subunit III